MPHTHPPPTRSLTRAMAIGRIASTLLDSAASFGSSRMVSAARGTDVGTSVGASVGATCTSTPLRTTTENASLAVSAAAADIALPSAPDERAVASESLVALENSDASENDVDGAVTSKSMVTSVPLDASSSARAAPAALVGAAANERRPRRRALESSSPAVQLVSPMSSSSIPSSVDATAVTTTASSTGPSARSRGRQDGGGFSHGDSRGTRTADRATETERTIAALHSCHS